MLRYSRLKSLSKLMHNETVKICLLKPAKQIMLGIVAATEKQAAETLPAINSKNGERNNA